MRVRPSAVLPKWIGLASVGLVALGTMFAPVFAQAPARPREAE
jgi:hypothetical protein